MYKVITIGIFPLRLCILIHGAMANLFSFAFWHVQLKELLHIWSYHKLLERPSLPSNSYILNCVCYDCNKVINLCVFPDIFSHGFIDCKWAVN